MTSRTLVSANAPIGLSARGLPEVLVGTSFRHWVIGYQTGDISLWERVWIECTARVGAGAASSVCTDLARWVRALRRDATREFEVAAPDATRFSRDECAAMAVVAACQHDCCPALRSCAAALLGCPAEGTAMREAERFAHRLVTVDHVLSTRALDDVVRLVALPKSRVH